LRARRHAHTGAGIVLPGRRPRWSQLNSNNSYVVSANAGYLFTKNIAGEASWTYGDDGLGDWMSTIGVKVKWLFTGAVNDVVPYVEVGGVYSKIPGTDDTEPVYGAGLDYFLKPNASIYLDVETYKLDYNSDWTWDTTVGFRFWFK